MPNLPMTPNATADIYHQGNFPPSPPDMAGVPVFIEEAGENIEPTHYNYTHIFHIALGLDVRDSDTFFVPNGSTAVAGQFAVQHVARRAWGTSTDHKVAYMNRNHGSGAPTWLSDYV